MVKCIISHVGEFDHFRELLSKEGDREKESINIYYFTSEREERSKST